MRMEAHMTTADEYRQYAEEAMRWARAAKTEQDRAGFIDLARTWMQAAQQRESKAA